MSKKIVCGFALAVVVTGGWTSAIEITKEPDAIFPSSNGPFSVTAIKDSAILLEASTGRSWLLNGQEWREIKRDNDHQIANKSLGDLIGEFEAKGIFKKTTKEAAEGIFMAKARRIFNQAWENSRLDADERYIREQARAEEVKKEMSIERERENRAESEKLERALSDQIREEIRAREKDSETQELQYKF